MAIDYSIECALPYIDDFASQQQQFEIAFNGLSNQVREDQKTFVRTLLVDDVTGEASENLNLDSYSKASADDSTTVLRESMLEEQADALFKRLKDSSTSGKIKTEQGYSSSFYIAVWTLIRLGYINHPDFPSDRVSNRIVNIIPEEWREGEEESLRLVRATPFAEAASKVEYIYL